MPLRQCQSPRPAHRQSLPGHEGYRRHLADLLAMTHVIGQSQSVRPVRRGVRLKFHQDRSSHQDHAPMPALTLRRLLRLSHHDWRGVPNGLKAPQTRHSREASPPTHHLYAPPTDLDGNPDHQAGYHFPQAEPRLAPNKDAVRTGCG